jgi:hypothetical protein
MERKGGKVKANGIINLEFGLFWLFNKVLRPARFKARVPGFGRVTRFDRVGRVNSLKKIQNNVVLVKKTKKTKVNGFVTGSWPVSRVTGSTRQITPGFFFLFFWSTWLGSSPGSAGSRIDPPSQAGFQN